MVAVLSKLFGSRNDRVVKKHNKIVQKINELEASIAELSDDDLKNKTEEFRKRLAEGETLESLTPEAFAVVREAGKRVMGMRHFDVQMVGGLVLDSGRIAEMKTGEGKTLVATAAAYLNALPGEGVHVITVNDYLAQRDSAWMGKLYGFLGLTTGCIISEIDHEQRKEAYAADITYGTNNEFGFDYLRDNMVYRLEDKVQRGLNFAIVDEVDSILIDEARTPLIISGPADDSSELYIAVNKLVPKLHRQAGEESEGDFWVDEKSRNVHLSEAGHQHVEDLLTDAGLLQEGDSLYDPGNIALMHHFTAALRAHSVFQKNVHYIVRDNQVVIVDEFTGRTMAGRRWSDGLHQAVEAKEGVTIQNENQTLASITYQNYFRLYSKLSGMTGTADTEAVEFQQIYGLEVIVIPTHRPMVREDRGDLVYLTEQEKFQAIIEDIKVEKGKKRPILVGTASIESSEAVSAALEEVGIEHQVLNAKQHEREAHIIAQAGRPGTVTIATNMAGRGTDIVLGGSLEEELKGLGEDADAATIEKVKAEWQERHDAVLAAGGLHIIGTERHESRRIDNQLRGRAGRQGDPGSTRFFLSMEDSLLRIFASERVSGMMKKLGMEEGEAIEHPWVTRAIENAQRKVEAHNFDIRKHLLEFDDVANDQRKVIYEQRDDLLAADDIVETVKVVREDVLNETIDMYIPPDSMEEQWDVPGLEKAIADDFGVKLPLQKWLDEDDSLHEQALRARLLQMLEEGYAWKEQQVPGFESDEERSTYMREFEKAMMLQVFDRAWKEHLASMDYLRQGIHLRGYAQKNPKQEYKREAFEMFSAMLSNSKLEFIKTIHRAAFHTKEQVQALEEQLLKEKEERIRLNNLQAKHESIAAFSSPGSESEGDDEREEAGQMRPRPQAQAPQPLKRMGPKVGRNDPCPCGSGKKFKQCHGKLG